MTSRHFPNGRFAYAMGYKSHDEAYEAMLDCIADGSMSPYEGRVESYDAGNGGHAPRKTRYAITVPA